MLANVVTPVPANDAPEKSFVALASPVFETSVRMPAADGRASERRRGRGERRRDEDHGASTNAAAVR